MEVPTQILFTCNSVIFLIIYFIDTNQPSKCCFSYLETRIPLRMVSNYERTRSDCTKPGIVFTTRKGHLLCADPEQKWVKDSVDHLNAIFKAYPEDLKTDAPSVGKK
uniref:C-C motif chemokine n=1 Tax=Erpetoichthys calabaricus TaxID=27687 RepID=A0A8C4RQ47_ERPCA